MVYGKIKSIFRQSCVALAQPDAIEAFDPKRVAGRILGTYDPTTGKTVDDTFRIVGTGNQLVGLIERAK